MSIQNSEHSSELSYLHLDTDNHVNSIIQGDSNILVTVRTRPQTPKDYVFEKCASWTSVS